MHTKKYIFAFLITAVIFGTALYVSNTINDKKLGEVRLAEDRLALNLLSNETQSALLKETSCADVKNNYLTRELGDLGEKLSFAVSQNNPNNMEIQNLRRYYYLLEINDYLLMKSVTEKCGIRPTFILYFYGDRESCPECEKTGYVLDALHEKYPDIRIYSFDYYSTEPAIRTLISIYHVEENLPAVIINNDPYYGFRSLETLETSVPAIARLKKELETSTTTATSTPRR